MQTQFVIGLSILVIGCVLPFFCFRFSGLSVSAFLVPLAVIGIGIGLMDWRVLLLFLAYPVFIGLIAYGFDVREKRYHRKFPVFGSPPVGGITTKDGFRYDLHVARIRAGFIIGMRYDAEVDATPTTIETRWKDVFPDYASARRALLVRLREYVSPERMPDPVTESAGADKPGPALPD